MGWTCREKLTEGSVVVGVAGRVVEVVELDVLVDGGRVVVVVVTGGLVVAVVGGGQVAVGVGALLGVPSPKSQWDVTKSPSGSVELLLRLTVSGAGPLA